MCNDAIAAWVAGERWTVGWGRGTTGRAKWGFGEGRGRGGGVGGKEGEGEEEGGM